MHARAVALQLAAAYAAAGLLAACATAQAPRREQLEQLHRVAIVSRVEPVAPRVALLTGKDAARLAALGERLASTVRRFEIEERLRVAVVGRLPTKPPWSTAMPAVEAATLLQDLLVDDAASDRNYRVLGRHGCDSVLELRVNDYGLREHEGKPVLFLVGRARLFTLPGEELGTVALRLELGSTTQGLVDPEALARGGYRDALIDLIDATAARAVEGLGIAADHAKGDRAFR